MNHTRTVPFITLAALFLACSASAQAPEFDPHRIIVKFRARSNLLARASSGARVPRLENLTPLRRDAAPRGTQPLPGGVERIFVADIPSSTTLEELLRQLSSDPEIEYAEPDYIGHGDGAGPSAAGGGQNGVALTPSDPDFYWQWGLLNIGQQGGKAGIDVNAIPAWNITTGDSNTILAVLDTGLAMSAPDFAGRILPGYDYVNNDSDPSDDYGHGTNVTSIAAAEGNNGMGIAGMNWKCRILPIKILNSQNSGNYSWFASAFTYAADHGARVINVSAGGSGRSQALADAVAYAQARGAIVVACMMNTNSETPYYPAALPDVIAVGGINRTGMRAVPFCYSSTSGSNYGSHISFVAPGDYVLGTDYRNVNGSNYWCGTSQATPLVSGLITLMLAVKPTLTRDEAVQALRAGARDQIGSASEDTPGWDKYFGYGLIDAWRSLSEVMQSSILFPQVAVGGGYSTIFTLVNTGAEAFSGRLTLARDDASPLTALLKSAGHDDVVGSTFPVSVLPGGTQTITASSPSPAGVTPRGSQAITAGSADAAIVAGWGLVVGSGGTLGGVATFQLMDGAQLTTVVGVLASGAVNSASIPIEDDRTLGVNSHVTGYAVANPGSEAINLRLSWIRPDGSQAGSIDPPLLNPLPPGGHIARFLWEDLGDPLLQFRGSMVLTAQSSAKFAITALTLNQGLYTAIPVLPAGGNADANMFAQVAVGGGYTTTCMLINAGTAVSSGTLTLASDNGTPLPATFSSPGNPDQIASSFAFAVAPGGAQIVRASAVDPSNSTLSGWARVDQSGGALGGVATFQLTQGNKLVTTAGVLAAGGTAAATIPIDDDRTLEARSRVTGYGVANPGTGAIRIRIVLVNPDGTIAKTLTPPQLNPLCPGCHVARFLWQDLADPTLRFTGSMVLIAEQDGKFSVVALVLNQGLYTAIPVIPSKSPAIR